MFHIPARDTPNIIQTQQVNSLFLNNVPVVQYLLATFVALRLAASIFEWSSHRHTGAYHSKFFRGFS